MTGFGIRRPDLIDAPAPAAGRRRSRQARWALAAIAALLVSVGIYLGASQDPVGVEQSRSAATAWAKAHPHDVASGGDSGSVTQTVHTPSGRVLTATLDNSGHRLLIASCSSDPCVPGRAPARTSTAATLHGRATYVRVEVPDGGMPHIFWLDGDGARLLVCSTADCLPGSFL